MLLATRIPVAASDATNRIARSAGRQTVPLCPACCSLQQREVAHIGNSILRFIAHQKHHQRSTRGYQQPAAAATCHQDSCLVSSMRHSLARKHREWGSNKGSQPGRMRKSGHCTAHARFKCCQMLASLQSAMQEWGSGLPQE